MKNSIQRIFYSIILLFFSFYSFSQSLKYCGTTEMTQKLLNEYPEMLQQVKKTEKELEDFTNMFAINKKKSGQIYIIPIVFHILHNYGLENISDDQIHDAMKIINKDFRKQNTDINSVVSSFRYITADIEVEFRLAQLDPQGNCTNGIDRIASQETYIGDDGSKLNQWPRNQYLNVWVVNSISSGAAGYAIFPSNANYFPSKDGIMLLHNYVGSIGTSSYSRSRTLTHEIGHYLNLYHTWGVGKVGDASNCNYDDGVSDTPNTIGWTSCNVNGTSCSSLDNIQNYMEYSYCTRMFTAGQATRMRATLNSSTAQRNNLWKASNLIATGTDGNDILCTAKFSSDYTILCSGQYVQFTDKSYYGQNSWKWNFEGGNPNNSSETNPTISYNKSGVFDVSLTVDNGISNVSNTETSYINVLPLGKYPPYSEGFENESVPNDDWFIVNQDKDNTWETNTNTSYSGSACLKMNNYNNTSGQTDEIISNTIDLSVLASVELKFKLAYAQKTTSDNDKLALYISIDCGKTWMLRWARSGTSLATVSPQPSTAFVPSTNSHWSEHTVGNISSTFLKDNFRFKFVFENDGGNNLYIDDINIAGNYNDIPLLVSPINYSGGLADSITLDWFAVSGVEQYQYQIDTTINFDSPSLINATTTYISSSSNNSDTEYSINNLSYNWYYWRVRTITDNDTSSWSQAWSFAVGITGFENNYFNSSYVKVFPNPFKNYVHISYQLKSLSSDARIIIHDILGRVITEFPLTKKQGIIRWENITNGGIYFVTLINGLQVERTLKVFRN